MSKLVREKTVPQRRCVGCMESKDKSELLRLTVGADGLVHPDVRQTAPGRGVYLCRCRACAEMAQKRNAVARGLHVTLTAEAQAALQQELEALL